MIWTPALVWYKPFINQPTNPPTGKDKMNTVSMIIDLKEILSSMNLPFSITEEYFGEALGSTRIQISQFTFTFKHGMGLSVIEAETIPEWKGAHTETIILTAKREEAEDQDVAAE